jgi:hypothetical protein
MKDFPSIHSRPSEEETLSKIEADGSSLSLKKRDNKDSRKRNLQEKSKNFKEDLSEQPIYE